jgi:hypothetical protein
MKLENCAAGSDALMWGGGGLQPQELSEIAFLCGTVTDTPGTVCFVKPHIECHSKGPQNDTALLLHECCVLWRRMTAGCPVVLLGCCSLEMRCCDVIPFKAVKMYVPLCGMADGLRVAESVQTSCWRGSACCIKPGVAALYS